MSSILRKEKLTSSSVNDTHEEDQNPDYSSSDSSYSSSEKSTSIDNHLPPHSPLQYDLQPLRDRANEISDETFNTRIFNPSGKDSISKSTERSTSFIVNTRDYSKNHFEADPVSSEVVPELDDPFTVSLDGDSSIEPISKLNGQFLLDETPKMIVTTELQTQDSDLDNQEKAKLAYFTSKDTLNHNRGNNESLDNNSIRRRTSSLKDFHDPFSNAEIYCGPSDNPAKAQVDIQIDQEPTSISQPALSGPKKKEKLSRTRTMSVFDKVSNFKRSHPKNYQLRRRGSEDDSLSSKGTRKLFIENVDKTLHDLLSSEDTDQNYQITVEDTGPKVLQVGTANSFGYNFVDIRGTYMLSNLLQELTIAQGYGRHSITLDESRLNENPVNRLTRLITTQFWDNLTRKIDLYNIGEIASDSKVDAPGAKVPRVYVPYNCPRQYEFYIEASRLNPSIQLEVEYLPKEITPQYVKSINGSPGLLALAMEEHFDPSTGEINMNGFPYCVPGGRFNELYGWDSYLMTLGLLRCNKVNLCKAMVEHFIFEIEHYGKILNANRSYYLCRSQPPFLTDMALKVFDKIGGDANPAAIRFLKRAFRAAIKEYKTVWVTKPRLDEETGLSCYHPDGIGIPPETEPSHFDTILTPYALKYGLSLEAFREKYNDKEIEEPDLDEFFLHDRAVRESGHDTTYRFEGVCAYLATIDLNALLYKYEIDIANAIEKYFNNSFEDFIDQTITNSDHWRNLASLRRERIDKYLWNEESGFYHDYNVKIKKRCVYESATTYWAMWAGLSSKAQAKIMIEKTVPKLEVLGGLVACTECSRGALTVNRPSRQWDYPYGWAPHQIFAWEGFTKYGYRNIATRLVYRWLFIMTKAFVDYNGIVVEKYDVTRGNDPHRVDAEYGNQGADFKGVAKEGFGWVNSSYIIGLEYMNAHARRGLGSCIPPVPFFNSLKPGERETYAL